MDKRGRITLSVIILSIVLVGFFSMYFVLAVETDNYKEFDETDLKYGKINILDKADVKLAEYILLENTDQCLINCYAEGTATFYTEGYLFSDLKFKDDSNDLTNIKSSKILIEITESSEIDVNDYKEVCEDKNINGTPTNICNQELTGTHKETKTKTYWKEYDNTLLSSGTYNWRIEGKKNIEENIDWIASSFGQDFTEWAWWNSSWENKKEISFTGTINENWTQELTFDKPANMNSNCNDIRFLNSSETNEIGHRNVLCNSTTVIEHIKINNNDTIYLYYDNAGASSTDDWRSTYQCGDDFNDYIGEPTNITEIQEEGTPILNVTGGELVVTKVDGSGTDHVAWLCDNWINYENYTYYDKSKTSVHDIQSPLVRWSSNTVGWALVRNMGANILNALHFTTFDGALDYNTNTAYDTDDNVFYNHTLNVSGTTYTATYKQSVSGADSITWSIVSATGWASSSKVGGEGSNSGFSTWDWYYIMPSQSNMPTYIFGEEETESANYTITFNLTDSYTGEQIDTGPGLDDIYSISCDNGYYAGDGDVENPHTATEPFTSGIHECTFIMESGYFIKTTNIAVTQNETIEIQMSESEGLTPEEHDWLEAIYECTINGVGCA